MGIYLSTVTGGLALVTTNQMAVYHFLQISVDFNFLCFVWVYIGFVYIYIARRSFLLHHIHSDRPLYSRMLTRIEDQLANSALQSTHFMYFIL